MENKSGKNATLISVGGAVYSVQNDALIKNVGSPIALDLAFGSPRWQLTTLTFAVGLIPSVKMQVPYTFYSE